jgi:hypothetical protein
MNNDAGRSELIGQISPKKKEILATAFPCDNLTHGRKQVRKQSKTLY